VLPQRQRDDDAEESARLEIVQRADRCLLPVTPVWVMRMRYGRLGRERPRVSISAQAAGQPTLRLLRQARGEPRRGLGAARRWRSGQTLGSEPPSGGNVARVRFPPPPLFAGSSRASVEQAANSTKPGRMAGLRSLRAICLYRKRTTRSRCPWVACCRWARIRAGGFGTPGNSASPMVGMNCGGTRTCVACS
jgi:hypothetical protein